MRRALLDNSPSVWHIDGRKLPLDAASPPTRAINLRHRSGYKPMSNNAPISSTLTANMLSRISEAHQEHHVVLWSGDEEARRGMAILLSEHLRSLPQVELFEFDGSEITDLASFCRQLTVQFAGEYVGPGGLRAGSPRGGEFDAHGVLARGLLTPEPVAISIDGPGGVIDCLRERNAGTSDAMPMAKRRYYLWHDADALLKRDPATFGAIFDAMAGIAAEAEYASEDLLLIHRAILVGGPALAQYAKNPAGQFQSWLTDTAGSPPLWKVITGLEHPPVAVIEL
jgi:hypothetical protein